jgi:photosystem II stability/assembly factor-like uncharacterized protein
MKTFEVIVGISLAVMLPAGAWETQAIGATHPIWAVQFAGPDTGYAVGDSGTVLKTTNGGISWTAQTIGTPKNLSLVHLRTGRIGWVVAGGSSLYRTTNGGQNWVLQRQDSSLSLTSLSFVNADTGWATSVNSVYKSVDGGQNWNMVRSLENSGTYSVHFVNATTGWLVGGYTSYQIYLTVGYPIVQKTTDGGASWTSQSAGSTRPLNTAHFLNKDTGWVAGGAYFYTNFPGPGGGSGGSNQSNIFRTTNGGATWVLQGNNPYDAMISSIRFADRYTGLAVGAGGFMLRTIDGGANWIVQNSGTSSSLSSLWIVSGVQAYATLGTVNLYRGNPSISASLGQGGPHEDRKLELRGNVLTYRLFSREQVSLKLLDPLGREVRTLKNGTEGTGDHQVTLPQSGIAPGTYIVDFRAGNIHETLTIQGP